MSFWSSTAFVATVLLILGSLGVARGFDFTGTTALGTIASCSPSLAGTSAPTSDQSQTNMTLDKINIVAATNPVVGRKMALYLGKDATNPTCFATSSPAGTPKCKQVFTLTGTWAQLRVCGWSGPDTGSRPGYDVRNNTFC